MDLPRELGFRAARPAGAGCTNGSSAAPGRGDGAACCGARPGPQARPLAAGDRRSIIDAKRGAIYRAKPRQPRLSLNQIPPGRRRHGWPLAGPARPRQRKRTRAPACHSLIAHRRRLPAVEVWADRGYCSDPTPRCNPRTRHHPNDQQTSPTGRPTRRRPDKQAGHTRPQTRHSQPADPLARHRWVVERTPNAWLRRFRRLNIRTEPNSQLYLAYLTPALIIILTEHSELSSGHLLGDFGRFFVGRAASRAPRRGRPLSTTSSRGGDELQVADREPGPAEAR